MKIAAKVISTLFHPIWMPAVGFYAIMYGETYVSALHEKIKLLIMAIMVLITIMLPLTSIPLLYNFKRIKSVEMDRRNERIIPMMISLLSYLFVLYAFQYMKIRLPILLLSFLIGVGFTNLMLLVINIWWKISVHMAGVGGMLALLFVVSWFQGFFSPWFFLLALGLSGWVASARLFLGAHNWAQVLGGISLGFLAVTATMLWF